MDLIAPRARDLATRYLPAAVVSAVFVAMLALSWKRWPDVLVDFGHELYIPWQLSEGKALGADIAMGTSGPLSSYLNALLFAVFGASASVLFAFNALVLAAITALVFALVHELSDRFTATLATAAFLAIFGFGQYIGVGNFNYLAPYSHGATHGMLLSLAAVWLLGRHGRAGGRWRLALAGGALGLTFLAKPEMFVACSAAVGLLWGARAIERRPVEALMELAWLVLAAVTVPVASFALLCLRVSPGTAWRVIAGPWLLMLTPLATSPFYVSGSGLNAPARNAVAMARKAAEWAGVLGAAALLDEAARRLRAPRPVAAALGAVAAAGVVGAVTTPAQGWGHIARPLPIVVALAAALYAARALARRPEPEGRARAVLGLALCAFAGLLLGKMILNVRIHQYGFVLAMPAGMIAIVGIAGVIPALLARRGGGAFFRGAAAGLVAITAIAFVRISAAWFDGRTFEVGAGGDAFLADERGAYVSAMLRRIEAVAAPGDTLAVLPAGAMVNFLARRANPTPYLSYLPDAIAAYGEERMLSAYRRTPPRFIVIVQRDASDHGAAYFGRDYARATRWWIDQNYEPVAVVGARPYESGAYGMMLLRRTGADPPRAVEQAAHAP